MTPAEVEELLRELAQRLSASGEAAGIRVIGGAAIALMSKSRQATQDIDAVLINDTAIRLIAAAMASERGLAPDWINDLANGFVPPVGMDDWVEVFRDGDVVVHVGSATMLLAMKLAANRGRRDTPDIEFLLQRCEVTSLAEVQAIYERYHAQDVISDAAVARVQSWLSRR